MKFLDRPPRFLFFTGAGGMGKASIACAAALRLAAAGRRVLLVSTDPASNAGLVFGAGSDRQIVTVPKVANLSLLVVEPQEAARDYRERIVGPARRRLPAEVLESMEAQLSAASATEVASFDTFTRLLDDPAQAADYEHILFDTAPSGHTIHVLQLPWVWSGFLEAEGRSPDGSASGLELQRAQYRSAVETLADPTRSRQVTVARRARE